MFVVNIRHAGIEAEDLNDVIKLKVVQRCKSSNMHEYYVLREYLTYQIWNLLSPYSFNTRLVRLKIIRNRDKPGGAILFGSQDLEIVPTGY